MKVIDKDLKISGIKCGVFQAYTDVEPELAVTPDTIKLTRVLPAPFFYEKRLYFFLVNRWEPGEKQGFPNGGFEVRDEGGALRSYDLDQVIIHPQLIKHKKTLDKMIRRAEKEAIKRSRKMGKVGKVVKEPRAPGGRRGRPALSPMEATRRQTDKISKAKISGGKRGRPKSTTIKPTPPPKTLGTKRGRPALTPEAQAIKAQAKAVITSKSGGRRGRPSKIKRR